MSLQVCVSIACCQDLKEEKKKKKEEAELQEVGKNKKAVEAAAGMAPR